RMNEKRDEKGFQYEDGVPVLDFRVNEIERKQKEAEAREETYRNQQLSINRRLMWLTGVLAVVSIIALVFNGIYTIISKRSADAAKSAAETAADTLKSNQQQFRLDQRPYLVTEPFGAHFVGNNRFAFVLEKDGDVSVRVEIEMNDAGKTPAVGVLSTRTKLI